MKFHLELSPWSKKIGVHFAQQHGEFRYVATNITFEKQDEGSILPPAPLTLSQIDAQELADQLYSAGIRPSAAAGTAGQIDAVKNHLEDMRTLVFKRAPNA